MFCWQVHLYDLSLGRDGVWHSGIVAYGREYFFTDRGLVSVMPVSGRLEVGVITEECPPGNVAFL